MRKEEIKDNYFEVTILNKGIEGEALCFNLHNDLLGDFVIGNCYLNAAPQYVPGAEKYLNGSCVLSLDDGECNFFATIVIYSDDSTKGSVLFRC